MISETSTLIFEKDDYLDEEDKKMYAKKGELRLKEVFKNEYEGRISVNVSIHPPPLAHPLTPLERGYLGNQALPSPEQRSEGKRHPSKVRASLRCYVFVSLYPRKMLVYISWILSDSR